MEITERYLELYKQKKAIEKQMEDIEKLFNELGEEEYIGSIGKVKLVNVKETAVKAHSRPAYSYYRTYIA